MDILGIGTEIVECLRIRRMIDTHAEQFLMRIYTPSEIAFCHARRLATEHFAAGWAAKEATFKALGLPSRRGIGWTDAEVVWQEATPTMQLHGGLREFATGKGVARVMLSVAFCRAYATATAILTTSAS